MKVVVVGGGVLGASAALQLVREGAQAVLVDRADQGRATAAGAGIVCPWGAKIDDAPAFALLAAGARWYPRLIGQLAEDGERDVGYARVGSVYAPDDPAELDAVERRLRERVAGAPEAGDIERLPPEEARRHFPPLRPGLRALHVSGGARVDGRLLTAAMTRAAIARGAEVVAGSAELVVAAGRLAGVRVSGRMIAADAVVVAAGAWAPALLAPLGIRLAVEPQRGQILHLSLPGTDTRHWSTVQPLNGYYLLAFDDSRVVVGATRERGSGFDHRLTAAGVAEVLNAGLATAPGLAGWTLHETRIGFRPLAADNRPMLGPVRGLDGLLIGNGLGASGLTVGPLAGRLLAEAALGMAASLPLADFDPLRASAARTA